MKILTVIWLLVVLVSLALTQTTVAPNQIRTTTTGLSQVTESVTKVTSPGSISLPACTGFLTVLRNGIDQTLTTDYTLSSDGLSISFLLISSGDLVKTRCFH